jgi:type II secretory pathway component PulM
MIGGKLDALRDRFERLSQRERLMVMAMGVVFVVLVTLVIGFFVTDGLSSLDEQNAAMRQALKDIESRRDGYIKARAKLDQLNARIGSQPLQLQGFLEQAAKDVGVEIPDSKDTKPEPAGKAYKLRLKSVRIDQLGAFLKKIETGQNLVLVTSLTVRTLDDKHQTLDVELTVTTYDHAPKKAEAKKGDKT